jgi:hypothetical protein
LLDSYTKNCINIRDEGGDKLEDQLHSRERERDPLGLVMIFFKDIMASIN